MVVFLLFLGVAKQTADVSPGGLVTFFLQMSMVGTLYGAALCFAALSFFRRTCTHSHEHAVLQICLSLIVAYMGYFVSENEMGSSGVLAAVFAALLFASQGWQWVGHRETMEDVWHTFEHMLNMVLFFLAGALLADIIIESGHGMEVADIGYVILTYVAVMLLRLCTIFSFLPILKVCGPPPDWRDAVVMTWGGLRGAVGIALAMMVLRSPRVISPEVSSMMAIHIGGVVLLTTMVNATTCGPLLNFLGMIERSVANRIVQGYVANTATEKAKRVIEEVRHALLQDDQAAASGQMKWVAFSDDIHCSNATIEEEGEKLDEAQAEHQVTLEIVSQECTVEELRGLWCTLLRSEIMRQVTDGAMSLNSDAARALFVCVDFAQDYGHLPLQGFTELQHVLELGRKTSLLLQLAYRTLPYRPFGERALRFAYARQFATVTALISFVRAHSATRQQIRRIFDPVMEEAQAAALESDTVAIGRFGQTTSTTSAARKTRNRELRGVNDEFTQRRTVQNADRINLLLEQLVAESVGVTKQVMDVLMKYDRRLRLETQISAYQGRLHAELSHNCEEFAKIGLMSRSEVHHFAENLMGGHDDEHGNGHDHLASGY